ncbi:MAG: VOC family protein [Sphingomonadales bacterium]|nr:VOC family protein [Sphingomonadales bacterium]MDE2169793.1 VOC family protein [Sphingomonadales bacterium]
MSHPAFVSPDEIRSRFSDAMSRMYREEVPLYGELMDIVRTVNARVLADHPEAVSATEPDADVARLSSERHGAIRVGTAEELRLVRRAFAVMGMEPVGYYDLAAAGVPVHSTAFRPIAEEALRRSAFRVFTSLLRLDLIEDEALRETARATLARRRICSEPAIALIERAEREGGLREADAAAFIEEVLKTFRWQSEALVDAPTYRQLSEAHRLIADVVSFRGPHINHLTPRTLDIDAAQAEMLARDIGAKAVIEGPPRRQVPILLRQTSFRAIEEKIRFQGDGEGAGGTHTARFGEIEQRGVALTRKGRALYDALLEQARQPQEGSSGDYDENLRRAFVAFPDTLEALRAGGLAYVRYAVTPKGLREGSGEGSLEDWLARGHVVAEPITYEDFLPVSAAGIFQSNLGDGTHQAYAASPERAAFEQALGIPVHDEFALYEALSRASLAVVRERLGHPASGAHEVHS